MMGTWSFATKKYNVSLIANVINAKLVHRLYPFRRIYFKLVGYKKAERKTFANDLAQETVKWRLWFLNFPWYNLTESPFSKPLTKVAVSYFHYSPIKVSNQNIINEKAVPRRGVRPLPYHFRWVMTPKFKLTDLAFIHAMWCAVLSFRGGECYTLVELYRCFSWQRLPDGAAAGPMSLKKLIWP